MWLSFDFQVQVTSLLFISLYFQIRRNNSCYVSLFQNKTTYYRLLWWIKSAHFLPTEPFF